MSTAIQAEVKERPIIFSGAMVKAILAGNKTQTRRVVKIPHAYNPRHYLGIIAGLHVWEGVDKWGGQLACPYGQTGERLWVREAFTEHTFSAGRSGGSLPKRLVFKADNELHGVKWTSPLFLPRDLSRINLEITNIRAERVQEISVDDIRAEGITLPPTALYPEINTGTKLKQQWEWGWDKINGKRKGCAWSDNPYCWVIEFKKL